MFIKEQSFIVKSSIGNIDVKNENQESKELSDLIRRMQLKQQSKTAAINQASNEIKIATDQEFHKIKLKRKSINCNRHVPKAKSN